MTVMTERLGSTANDRIEAVTATRIAAESAKPRRRRAALVRDDMRGWSFPVVTGALRGDAMSLYRSARHAIALRTLRPTRHPAPGSAGSGHRRSPTPGRHAQGRRDP